MFSLGSRAARMVPDPSLVGAADAAERHLLMSAAPLSATALFLAVVAAVFFAIVAGVHRAGRALGEPIRATRAWTIGTLLALGAWLGITATLAGGGLLRDFARLPPPLFLLVAVSLLLTLSVAFSAVGKRLALGLGVAALIGFQAFRLPLELFLFQMEQAGIVPVQMTFAGRNFDILTGITAIPVAWLVARGRLPAWGALLWNLLGLGLLVNIVVVAILSTPVPFRAFHEGPANTIVAEAPFVWLPVFLVMAALLGHLLLFRRLRHGSQEEARLQRRAATPHGPADRELRVQ